MAIVIEGEKRTKGIIGILVWIIVLVAVGAAAYYIFFRRPEIIEIATPANFQNTERLSKVKLTPEEITQNPLFLKLKAYVSPLVSENAGRQNPFLGF
ncbi:MAG: hypothetical protein AAB495_04600 [Patescibacteria group bacterium]